jgi:hypothetical protein
MFETFICSMDDVPWDPFARVICSIDKAQHPWIVQIAFEAFGGFTEKTKPFSWSIKSAVGVYSSEFLGVTLGNNRKIDRTLFSGSEQENHK